MPHSPCLYDATSKVIAADADTAGRLRAGFDAAAVLAVTAAEPGIVLADADGRAVAMEAPACGATVLAGPAGDAGLGRVAALWHRAGLPPPVMVDTGAGGADTAVLRALLAALEAELAATSRAAVDLDAQIAALREELEDTRATLADQARQLQALGQWPVERFAPAPSGGRVALEPGRTVRQPLPVSGHAISAIGLRFAADSLRGLDGAMVEARLVAREDGAVLGCWAVRLADVEDAPGGEALLALTAPVARRYRYLDLEVAARGAAARPPALLVARDGGDDRMTLCRGGSPRPGEMLALRLWTGPVLAREARNDRAILAADEAEVAARRYRLPLPGAPFRAARKLTTPTEDLKWFRHTGGDVFCHPAVSTPSVVALPLALDSPVAGVATRMELAHPQAFPTEFGLLCATVDLDAAQVLALLERGEGAGGDILALAPWAGLQGGTARAVELAFARPAEQLVLYLATRVRGGRNDFAHAWFRELSLIHAGALHAAA